MYQLNHICKECTLCTFLERAQTLTVDDLMGVHWEFRTKLQVLQAHVN
jgi:hypothetical protein